MQWTTRSSQRLIKMPTTQVYHLLDNQMTLVVRAWGSQEYNQRFIEEVSMYLSSAQAELDLTSPFDFKENLSSLANKTRVAFLLAQDFFYKTQNKSEFTVGFEAAVLFQLKKELAWSSVGRFSLKKIHPSYLQTLFDVGTDRDQFVLLPVELLGVESDVEINSGSISLSEPSELVLSSTYGGNLELSSSNSVDANGLHPTNQDMSYWFSLVKTL